MADAADVQSLFLQVDASVELLRRNLAAGEQPLGRFEQRAQKMAASVDKSIGDMGGRFGTFAKLAEDAAQRAERSFTDSFNDIQKMAAKAITAPSVKGGGLNLGAAEARQAADAARQQAQALALIETAARAAAAGEGVMTAETRLYLQAAQAARIEGEQHAAALMREAGALERLEIETRAAAGGQQLLLAGHRNVIVSQGQQRASTMMLGQQVQDFAVQVVSGQSALIAFSQQVGQAAFAVQGMGGKAASVAAFLGSGWGSALLVATTVIIPLVGKMMEKNNALEDGVAKLKKDAEQTAISNKAHAIFTQTLQGQIEAQKELNREMERGLVSQSQQNQQNLQISINRQADAQRAVRDKEDALAVAERRLQNVIDSRPDTMSSAASSAYAARLASARQQRDTLRTELENARQQVTRTGQGVRDAQITIAVADAKAAVDPLASINKRYDDMADKARAAARGSDQLTASIRGQLTEIEKQRVAALKAEQDRQAAERRSESDVRNGRVTPGQVGNLLKGEFGGTVTSTTGGKHVANSYHYRGQAVDFVPRGGMGSISKDDVRAYLESQGINIKELLGPGDKGHSDHFHVAFAKSQRSQDQIASRIETAQNAILADQISYAEQERQARRRLIDAQGRSAATEEERDRLAREEIEADYGAQKTKIAAQVERKDLKPEQAAELNRMNEQTRDQRLNNVKIDRARQKIAAGYDAEAQGVDARMAMLRIEGDMAITAAERRRIALELLALEQEQRRRALERVRDTSDDANEVQRARDSLAALPSLERAEREQQAQRQAGPMDQYRQRLEAATGDMSESLEQVKVNGLESLEDGLANVISGTESVSQAFRRMASSIIADLVRIAVQKLIMSAVGSVGGAATGGKVEGKATGGKISGPGTGTSDSILAMLGSRPIMLSNGESIVTAEATAKFWPIIDAMNKGKITGFAGGGRLSRAVSETRLPSLSEPRLPSLASAGGARGGTYHMGDTNITLHAEGAGPREVDVLRAEIASLKDEVPSRAVAAVRDFNERTFGRGMAPSS